MKKIICKRPADLNGAVMGGEKYLLCIPINGKTDEDVIKEVKTAAEVKADMIEWRIDSWDKYPNVEAAIELMKAVHEAADGMGILVTPRSRREMDKNAEDITDEEKFALIYALADTGLADAFDVEYFYGEEVIGKVSEELHKRGCKLLVARHEQGGVLDDAGIHEVLRNMQEWGGDIAKLCVFNQTFGEFFHFACLVKQAREEFMEIPMVTAAERSGLSRALGDVWGTDMIFVTADGSRQPGINDLRAFREMIWSE